jgi:RimJ/RimL family protein N-acetyltransferase
MFIRTDRLFLRPGWVEDAPELARAIAHEPVVRMLARVPWPYREEHALAFLGTPGDPRLPTLLVTLPEEGGRIGGGCGLHEGEGGAVEVGYWITPECWGRGYAREALRGLVRTARWIGHTRLTARPALENLASANVLRANGFQRTGQSSLFPSLGRGDEMVSGAEYALELVPASAPSPDWTRPAAYAEGEGLGAAA